MKVEAFVIHLARAHQRRKQVDRILEGLPIPARVVDAVDGFALSQQQSSEAYVRDLHRPRYPFVMERGEIGCFLSHRQAWMEIVSNSLDAGLIVEDDVEVDPLKFGAAFAAARDHIGELGYVQFQVRPAPTGAKVLHQTENVRLVRPLVTPRRTSAQLVSNAAAARLLAATEHFDRPIDGVLQMHWLTQIRPACAEPSGVVDRTTETGGSTISRAKTSVAGRLRRELLRGIYRLRITYRSLRSARGQTP